MTLEKGPEDEGERERNKQSENKEKGKEGEEEKKKIAWKRTNYENNVKTRWKWEQFCDELLSVSCL